MLALIVALVVAIPVALFPVAYLGYLTIGGIQAAIREARKTGAEVRGKATA